MTIRIKGDLGTEKEIFDILVQVARCDPLLTTGRYYADWKVNYAGSKPAAAAAAMLHDLCNNDWSIVIFGYPSDANCPDGTPIISIGGGTAVGRDIELYFDAYDAFYQGYIVDGAQGGTISIPPPVLMVHELSHVYHTVHTMAGKTQMDEEIQAIVVENAFRGQVGLPARKSDSHWGAPGVPSRPSPPFPYCIAPYQGWNCGCHIATAAIGAPSARSIVEFQRAVKEFETWTVGETPLLRPLLDAYQLFGPLVAADVRADPVLRADMLRDVVRPAHQLLRVVRVCLDTPPEDPRVAAEIAHAVTTYRVA
ncbi:MAG: hypothetical protein HOQ24_08550, partial [Mycobacteriaceae bacterium]|nr:hypothetical protein [Mycobacteriaceae bacterium]